MRSYYDKIRYLLHYLSQGRKNKNFLLFRFCFKFCCCFLLFGFFNIGQLYKRLWMRLKDNLETHSILLKIGSFFCTLYVFHRDFFLNVIGAIKTSFEYYGRFKDVFLYVGLRGVFMFNCKKI